MQGRMSVDRGSFSLTPSRNSGCSIAAAMRARSLRLRCDASGASAGLRLPTYFDSAEFDEYKDLLDSYVNGGMSYAEFVGRAASAERTKDFDEDLYAPFDGEHAD